MRKVVNMEKGDLLEVKHSEYGDVKLVLKSGEEIISDVYEKLEDHVIVQDGTKVHLGLCFKINDEIFPAGMVHKIVLLEKRIEEVVVWGHTPSNRKKLIKTKERDDPDEV